MYRQSGMVAPLLVSAVNGVVRAHEKTTGKKAWQVSLTELPYRSIVRLVVDGEHVIGFGAQSRAKNGIFGGNEIHGVLFMLDYASGRIGWTSRVEGPIFSPTLLVDAPHVFLANGGILSAFDLEDGRIVWQDTDVGEVWTSRGSPFTHPVALATPASNAQGDGY